MALKRGFKAEANRLSRQFREELDVDPSGKLCPWALAEFLGIPVLQLSSLASSIPDEVGYLMHDGRECFSAVTVSVGWRRTILHNDANHPNRQASDIAHELAHAILMHPPSPPFSEVGKRVFDKDLEEEANWLGFALLVSEEAALHIAKSGWSDQQAAAKYSVSEDVVKMRLGVTAARKRIKLKAR